MALREPKDVLHKGRRLDEILDAHARWLRNEAGGVRADLTEGKLFSVRLRGRDLSYANLTQCDLHLSDLRECDLIHAELAQADLRDISAPDGDWSFVIATQAQCHKADFSRCEMQEIMFDEAHLIATRLRGAGLVEASFRSAKLFRADLRGSDLTQAQCADAEWTDARLGSARLHEVDFVRCRMFGADCRGAEFLRANLRQTKFDEAWLGHTRIRECDLSSTFGLENVKHFGPTSLDAETMARSGKLPTAFLYGAGVPASQTKDPSPQEASPRVPICFVAFTGRDAELANRLRLDLMANGVRTWLQPEEVRWDGIELDRSPCDRLIVICSRAALQSRALVREIEGALAREERERADVLVPVRVDDYVVDEWEHEQKPAVLAKTVGDFRSWKNQELYRSALDWLLHALSM